MKRIICPMIVALLAASPALANEKTAKPKPNMKSLIALSELPKSIDEAVKAGASEEEVGRTVREMKDGKLEAEAANGLAKQLLDTAREGTSDKGMSEVVHACLAQGKRGQELVACAHDEWEKKPKVKKGERGGPGGSGEPGQPGAGPNGPPGPPDGMGKPEDKGPPEDKGKVEGDKGKPEDKGKVEGDKGKPEDKGKIEGDKGKPEDKGKAEGKGKPEPKGGH